MLKFVECSKRANGLKGAAIFAENQDQHCNHQAMTAPAKAETRNVFIVGT